jgi:thiol-disulfide isomerase/thioredoxin
VKNAGTLIVAVVFVLVAASVFFFTHDTGALRNLYHGMGFGNPPQVKQGEALPALTFEALDGSSVTLRAAPKHVTFVNVFATWCPPCRAEEPALASFARSESARGVDVIGIDRQESPQVVNAYRAQFHASYPMIIDQSWVSRDVLGARAMPQTIVVDAHGVIRAIVAGPMTSSQMLALAASARE